jgi:hypothetical protein
MKRLGGALAFPGASSVHSCALLIGSARNGNEPMTDANSTTTWHIVNIRFDHDFRVGIQRRLDAVRWSDAVPAIGDM